MSLKNLKKALDEQPFPMIIVRGRDFISIIPVGDEILEDEEELTEYLAERVPVFVRAAKEDARK